MTEQEALASLVAEFNQGEELPEAPQAEQAETPQIDKAELPNINAILQDLAAKQEALNAKLDQIGTQQVPQGIPQGLQQQGLPTQGLQQQGLPPQAVDPMQEQLSSVQRELGISQMKEQMEKQQAFIDEQNRKLEFINAWNDFTKTHPNVTQDELAKWANDNKLNTMLSSKEGWEAIYQAMQFQAKSKSTPDAITPTDKGGIETSAFDRRAKGEKVSDIELGLDLINSLSKK